MYVNATSTRFSRGRSTPAIRAMPLPLPLLVARVRADDHHDAAATDHLALLAHLADARTYLHRSSVSQGVAIRPDGQMGSLAGCFPSLNQPFTAAARPGRSGPRDPLR